MLVGASSSSAVIRSAIAGTSGCATGKPEHASSAPTRHLHGVDCQHAVRILHGVYTVSTRCLLLTRYVHGYYPHTESTQFSWYAGMHLNRCLVILQNSIFYTDSFTHPLWRDSWSMVGVSSECKMYTSASCPRPLVFTGEALTSAM